MLYWTAAGIVDFMDFLSRKNLLKLSLNNMPQTAFFTYIRCYLVLTVHVTTGSPSDSAVMTTEPVWSRLALMITSARPLKALRS